jgi:hypothetical protein
MLAGAALAFALTSAATAEPLENWLGTWSNPDSSGLVGLDIAHQGGALTVTGRGACTPNPCDWGATSGSAHAPSPAVDPADDTTAITATWNQGFSMVTVVLNRTADGALSAQTFTHFTDGSGRTDYSSTTTLMRQITINPGLINPGVIGGVIGALTQVPNPDEDCIAFDPETVRAEEVNGSWKVTSGSMWMLDAGSERDEMRTAAYFIRHYGFTQQCFVGRPDASLAYWLTPTGAASGTANSEDCVSINPNALSVSGSGSSWRVLSNGDHAAFSAPSQDEANRIVEIVERYGFTQSCFVGRPGPSMTYLKR